MSTPESTPIFNKPIAIDNPHSVPITFKGSPLEMYNYVLVLSLSEAGVEFMRTLPDRGNLRKLELNESCESC
jgi:hypothetical protein